MSFDALNRYSANHKPWDHVGNIVPDVEHSEGERPAFEWRVASWLPVQFYDKYFENWVVVMPGKTVALDPDGAVMPGEYGATTATVTYTADDIAQGTIDVATGNAVTTAKTVCLYELTGTLSGTAATAGTSGVTSGFMGRGGIAWPGANGSSTVTARYPIGVAPYCYLQWAGGDGFNPSSYHYHNYNMQHQVAVLCDYVIKLPLVPAQAATQTLAKSATSAALQFGTGYTYTTAYARSDVYGRYNQTTGLYPIPGGTPVVAFSLSYSPVAHNTSRTTITMQSSSASDDLSSILVNEVSSLSAIKKSGEFWVDYDVGVLFIYSSDGATIPVAITGAGGTVSLTYYRLDTAPGTTSKFASVLAGNIQPGDFLKTSTGSNLAVANPGSDTFANIMGQVLGFEKYPRDGLDKVKTAFNPPINTNSAGAMYNGTANTSALGLGQMDRMPGSADGGMPDLINFAGAADTLVIINLVSR